MIFTLSDIENIVKTENPSLFNEILSFNSRGKKSFVVTTKYGDVKLSIEHMREYKSIPFIGAIDPTNFWINRNKDYRKDFDDIDYSEVEYKNVSTKVKLKCKKHDYNYTQRPSQHTAGTQGCIYCMKQIVYYNSHNIETHKDFFNNNYSYLYFLRLWKNTETFYKVGMTADHRLHYRLKALKLHYEVEVLHTTLDTTYNNFYNEEFILQNFSSYSYTPKIKFQGYTECFKDNILDLYTNFYYNWINYTKEEDIYLCEQHGIDYIEQLNY